MQVNSSHHSDPVGRTEMYRKTREAISRGATDGASFEQSAQLEQALQSSPDVRAEVVEKARKLIEDTNYPPPEAINRIANLLAMKLAIEPKD